MKEAQLNLGFYELCNAIEQAMQLEKEMAMVYQM